MSMPLWGLNSYGFSAQTSAREDPRFHSPSQVACLPQRLDSSLPSPFAPNEAAEHRDQTHDFELLVWLAVSCDAARVGQSAFERAEELARRSSHALFIRLSRIKAPMRHDTTRYSA